MKLAQNAKHDVSTQDFLESILAREARREKCQLSKKQKIHCAQVYLLTMDGAKLQTCESGSEVGTHPVQKFGIFLYKYRDIFLVWGGLAVDYGCGIDITHHKHDFSFGFGKKY